MSGATGQKQTESRLKENEKFLTNVFNAIQDGLSVLDRDLRIIRTNKWMERMYKDTMPLVGKKCYRAYQGRRSACPWCPSVPAIKKGTSQVNTVPYFSGRKQKGWISLSAYPLKDEKGKVTGVIEHVKDITEEKAALNKLQMTQYAVEKASVGVFWIGKDSRFIYANETACKTLGYSRERLCSMKVSDIDPIFRKEIWPGHWKELKGKKTLIFESQHKTRSGRVFPVEIAANYMVFDGLEYNVAFARDISERKKVEEMKDNLMRNVSHELKTPVAMIEMACGMCDRGLESMDPARLQKAHSIVMENAARLRADVENILELFSLSAGKLREKEEVSLRDIISRKIIPGLDGLIREKKIEVEIHIHEDADDICLDPVDAETLLKNLINNAIKFTERGKIRVATATKGRSLELKVTDAGCGIRKEYIDKVFERFYQISPASPGTGLGLTICKEIAEKYGGKIKVRSQGAGKGTTVRVILPAGRGRRA